MCRELFSPVHDVVGQLHHRLDTYLRARILNAELGLEEPATEEVCLGQAVDEGDPELSELAAEMRTQFDATVIACGVQRLIFLTNVD